VGLIQPLSGLINSYPPPRVARASQLWAECFNPFGIGKTDESIRHLARHSTENSEVSPVASKPASQGRFKTGHPEVLYSYQFS
jgi:hypothetical protein